MTNSSAAHVSANAGERSERRPRNEQPSSGNGGSRSRQVVATAAKHPAEAQASQKMGFFKRLTRLFTGR